MQTSLCGAEDVLNGMCHCLQGADGGHYDFATAVDAVVLPAAQKNGEQMHQQSQVSHAKPALRALR